MLAPHTFSTWFLSTAAAVACFASSSAAQQPISSTFDNGAEEWSVTTILDEGPTVGVGRWDALWSPSSGLPDGCIYSSDAGEGTFAFSAPSKFLGDKSAYLDGSIAFDMRNNVADYDGGNAYWIVTLHGGGTVLAHIGAYPTEPDAWVHVDAPLHASSWYRTTDWSPVPPAEFSSVLADVQGLYLHADWGWGSDAAWIDNVYMQVPEPGSLGAWVIGAVGLLRRARRA